MSSGITGTQVEDWVAMVKASYPDLPDHLPLDLERRHLATLEPWLARVREHRGKAGPEEDESLASANPNRTRDYAQSGPVLHALDDEPLSKEAEQAWHELFVMLSAHLAKTAAQYYSRYCLNSDTMTLGDVLAYTPLAFFYALASYNPEGERSAPTTKWVGDGPAPKRKKSVRLLTWVYQSAPRFVRQYLEFYASPIRQGSGHTHRFRTLAYRTSQFMEARDGVSPSYEALSAELRTRGTKSHDDAAAALDRYKAEFMLPPQQSSLDDTPYDVENAPETFASRIEGHEPDVENLFDADAYLRDRVGGDTTTNGLYLAAKRLIESDHELTAAERHELGF